MSDYASTSSRSATPVGDLPNFASTPRPYRFNWDNRKPGPGSVASEATEGRGEYFASNAIYDLYNTSATSLTTAALPSEWSSTLHGFHAISTVVNNPHKRSDPPKAHSSLPSVPPADLPRVRRKDFDAYLRSVAPEWERFKQNAEQGREGVAQIDGPSSSQHLSVGQEDVPFTPRTPRPLPGRPLPSLESVPELFFDAKFDLGDPRTFNSVIDWEEHNENEISFVDPLSVEHTQPVLDHLSHYADTIEQHLVREISLRSTSFFAALANLQDLQSESEQCLDRIRHLRGLLRDVDEKGAKKGLEIVQRENRLQNIASVKRSVKFVGGVIEMTGVAKSLVNAGQWGEALNVIDELHSLWDADSTQNSLQPPTSPPRTDPRSSPLPTVPESPPESPSGSLSPSSHPKKSTGAVPISSLQAFAALPSHLRDLTLEITSSLTSEVVNVLRLDLIERVDGAQGGRNPEGGLRLSLKDKLRPLLLSLARTSGVREVTLSWKEVVMAEVKGLLRRRIPAFDFDFDDPHSNRGAETAKEVRAMAHLAFMDIAREMYTGFLIFIDGLQAQGTAILEVLEAIRHPKSSIDLSSIREDLSDILSGAGELANGRAAKVVNVRAEQHTNLELVEFYTFFNVSWDFVVKSEVICKRMIVALRGVIVSQAKSFLQAFHQHRISQSAKLVEDEQWNPAEVLPPVQRQIDYIVDSSIQDPRDLLFDPPPPNPLSPLPPNSPLPVTPSLTANGIPPTFLPSSPLPSPNPSRLNGTPRRTNNSGKHLKIEDRNYFAVGATLEVLMLLVDYLKVIMNLPMLTTDSMSRVIELLKAFNSRTCQVVLGAGAMRSAGLKNITAKHLALASQSLSIMISLIPYVRETFRRHLNPKQAVILIEFDKLKRDYQDHQNEIHAKLIAIMGDRLTAHIRTLQTVRWDLPPQREGVNEYMELLVKETVTLHKVLSRYMSPSIVEYVMSQVFAAINHRLSEEYTRIELPSKEAKERLLVDARYLIQKLSGLKNVASPTAMLELVVSEKSLKAPPPSPAPVPTPVVSTPSRFKGMLGRAESLRKASMPTPPVQPSVPEVIEKALPPPSNPTPPVVTSVTPLSSPSPQPRSTQPTPVAGATENSTTPPPLEHPLDQGTPPQLGATVPKPGLIATIENMNGTTTQNESPELRQSGDHSQTLELQEPPITTADMPKSPPPPPTPEKDRVQAAENGNVTGQSEETS